MNDDLRIWKVADAEANRMAAKINRLQAENDRMREVLEGIQISANCMMDGWQISDRMMDEIAEVLGNEEEATQ